MNIVPNTFRTINARTVTLLSVCSPRRSGHPRIEDVQLISKKSFAERTRPRPFVLVSTGYNFESNNQPQHFHYEHGEIAPIYKHSSFATNTHTHTEKSHKQNSKRKQLKPEVMYPRNESITKSKKEEYLMYLSSIVNPM